MDLCHRIQGVEYIRLRIKDLFSSVVRGVHDPPWCSEPMERRHDVVVRVVRDACWSQVMYLRAVFCTNFFIGRLVFEFLPHPFFDLIGFARSV
jgi:hypothetical protein